MNNLKEQKPTMAWVVGLVVDHFIKQWIKYTALAVAVIILAGLIF